MIFLHLVIQTEYCKNIYKQNIWDVKQTCSLDYELQPKDKKLNVINIINLHKLIISYIDTSFQLQTKCLFSALELNSNTSLLKNLIFHVNTTLNISDCSVIDFSLFNNVNSTITNVTITGTVIINNFDVERQLISPSIFLGYIYSSSKVSNCKSSLKFIIKDKHNNIKQADVVTSSNRYSFKQNELMIVDDSIAQFNLSFKQITIDNIIYNIAYDRTLDLQLFNINYQMGYLVFKQLNIYSQQDQFMIDNKIIYYLDKKATFLVNIVSGYELLCINEYLDISNEKCVKSKQEGLVVYKNILLKKCPILHSILNGECVVNCPSGYSIQLNNNQQKICVICSNVSLNNVCLDQCGVSQKHFHKKCISNCQQNEIYDQNGNCVQKECIDQIVFQNDKVQYQCTDNCPLSSFYDKTSNSCVNECLQNILLQEQQFYCSSGLFTNSVQQNNSIGRSYQYACDQTFLNQTGSCKLQCDPGNEAVPIVRQCFKCQKYWSRSTKKCVDECHTDALNASTQICESITGEHCQFYYEIGLNTYQCVTTCQSVNLVKSRTTNKCIPKSQCEANEAVINFDCQLCPSDKFLDQQQQMCVDDCEYYKNFNICGQINTPTCLYYIVTNGKMMCQQQCTYYSYTNKLQCLLSCSTNEPFYYENTKTCYPPTYLPTQYYSLGELVQDLNDVLLQEFRMLILQQLCNKVYGLNKNFTQLTNIYFCTDSCEQTSNSLYLLNQQQCVNECPQYYDDKNNCTSQCYDYLDPQNGKKCYSIQQCLEKDVYIDSIGNKYCTLNYCNDNQLMQVSKDSNQISTIKCVQNCQNEETLYTKYCTKEQCSALSARMQSYQQQDLKFNQNKICVSQCVEGFGYYSNFTCYQCQQFYDRQKKQCSNQCQSFNVSVGSDGTSIKYCEIPGDLQFCKFVSSKQCAMQCNAFIYQEYRCVQECIENKYDIIHSNKYCNQIGQFQEKDNIQTYSCNQQQNNSIINQNEICDLNLISNDQVINIIQMNLIKIADPFSSNQVFCKSQAFENLNSEIKNKIIIVNSIIDSIECQSLDIQVVNNLNKNVKNLSLFGSLSVINAPNLLNIQVYDFMRNSNTNTIQNSANSIKYNISSMQYINQTEFQHTPSSVWKANGVKTDQLNQYTYSISTRNISIYYEQSTTYTEFVKNQVQQNNIYQEIINTITNAQVYQLNMNIINYTQNCLLIKQKNQNILVCDGNNEMRCELNQYIDIYNKKCVQQCEYYVTYEAVCSQDCLQFLLGESNICIEQCPKNNVVNYDNKNCQHCSGFVVNNTCLSNCPLGQIAVDGVCREHCKFGMQNIDGVCSDAVDCEQGQYLITWNKLTFCTFQCAHQYISISNKKLICLDQCPQLHNQTHCIDKCEPQQIFFNQNQYCGVACPPNYVNSNGHCNDQYTLCQEFAIPHIKERICIICNQTYPFFDRTTGLCMQSCNYLNKSYNICEIPSTVHCPYVQGMLNDMKYCVHVCQPTQFTYQRYDYIKNFEVQYCVSDCNSISGQKLFYQLQNRKCVVQCPNDSYYQLLNGLFKICTDRCTNFHEMINGQKSCLEECKNTTTNNIYPNMETLECVNNCSIVNLCGIQDNNSSGGSNSCRYIYYKFSNEKYDNSSYINNLVPVCTFNCPHFAPTLVNNICMYTCPEDQKYLDKGICTIVCPNNSFSYSDINGAPICTNYQCEFYEIIDKMKRCRDGCTDDQRFYSSNIFLLDQVQCINICPEKAKFVNQDNMCVSQCTYLIYNYETNRCEVSYDNCKYLIDDNSQYACTQQCPLDKQYQIQLFEIKPPFCVQTCPSTSPFITNENICINQCDYIIQQSNKLFCVENCDNYSYFQWYDDHTMQCLEKCEQGNVHIDKLCSKYCPPSYYLVIENQSCILLCDNYFYVDENDQKICLQAKECTTQYQFLIKNQCMKKCPGQKPYELDTNCYASCPNDINIQSFYIQNSYYCTYSCSSEQPYVNKNTCQQQCPLTQFKINTTNQNQTLFCDSKCSYFVYHVDVLNNNLKRCYEICPNPNKFYEANGQCVELCQSLTYEKNNFSCQKVNSTKCPYRRQSDNTTQYYCVTSCEQHEVIYKGICQITCSADLPFLFMQICRPSQYYTLNQTNNGVIMIFVSKKCSTYYTVNGTLIRCQDACEYNQVIINTLQCVASCPSQIPFIDFNRNCVSRCDNYIVNGIILQCVTSCTKVFVYNHTTIPKNQQCIDKCPASYNYLLKKQCVIKCPENHPFIDFNNQCKQTVPYYVIDSAGNLKESKECADYYCINSSTNNQQCVISCPKYIINHFQCIDECPPNYQSLNRYCVDISTLPQPCNDFKQNGICVKQCSSGFQSNGEICEERCEGDKDQIQLCKNDCLLNQKKMCSKPCGTQFGYRPCCSSLQIRVGNECVRFTNQPWIFDNDEKVQVDCNNGIVISTGECIAFICPSGEVVIPTEDGQVPSLSQCQPEENCRYQIFNGICTSLCDADQFLNILTKECQDECEYRNGIYCENFPTEEEHCQIIIKVNDRTYYNCINYSNCTDVIIDESRECVQQCPLNVSHKYINESGTFCFDTCPNDKPYFNTTSKICNIACKYYTTNENLELVCLPNCNSYKYYEINSTNQMTHCVNECSSPNYLLQKGYQCVSKCDKNLFHNQFSSTCDTNCGDKIYYADNKSMTCVLICNTTLYYQDPKSGQTCWNDEECDIGGNNIYIYNNNQQCMSQCTGENNLYFNNYCINQCPIDYPLQSTDQLTNKTYCVQQCLDDKKYIDQTLKCQPNCQSGYFVQQNDEFICLHNCNNFSFQTPVFDGQTNMQECVEKCNNGNYIYSYYKQCMESCPKFQLFYTCYDQCPQYYINVTAQLCDVDCKFFAHGKCLQHCDVDTQDTIYTICMEKDQNMNCKIKNQKAIEYPTNQCVEYKQFDSSANESNVNLIYQILPDLSYELTNCEDGIIVNNNQCIQKCHLTKVWIHNNCYDLKYCSKVKQIQHRYVCYDSDDVEDQFKYIKKEQINKC